MNTLLYKDGDVTSYFYSDYIIWNNHVIDPFDMSPPDPDEYD